MNILVMGAGPLGSLFAARLHEAGHTVTLMARGQRLADLRQYGLVLEDAQTGIQTVTPVQLTDRLAPEDAYDLVLVIMRKNHASGVLPALATNRHAPNVLFLMNNAAGPEALTAALGKERVLIGFPMSAGTRQGHVMRVLGGSETQPVSIPFGEADGSITARTHQVAQILSSMNGYQAEIHTDMDAWLKTHVALLMPSLVPALYACGTDNYRMARTRDAVVLALRAVREGFAVLEALGIPVVGTGFKRFLRMPEPLVVALLGKLLARKEMETALVGHALAAPDELKVLADEFMQLVHASGVPTPNIDRLAVYFDPTTPALADGSAEIPLDWRSTAIALLSAAGIVAGVFFIARRCRKK